MKRLYKIQDGKTLIYQEIDGIESKVLKIQLAEEEAFLQKLIELQKAENNNG